LLGRHIDYFEWITCCVDGAQRGGPSCSLRIYRLALEKSSSLLSYKVEEKLSDYPVHCKSLRIGIGKSRIIIIGAKKFFSVLF
jgi:hypothetical protein